MDENKMNENEMVEETEMRHTEEIESPVDRPNMRHVDIDFGECPVFGEYVKTVLLDSLHNTESLCYKIMRDPDLNQIYQVFNFNKYEGVVKSGEQLKLKITYRPTIPYLKDIENFEFVDSSFNIIKIKVAGDCIGPSLKASVKQLDFLITANEKLIQRTVELVNVSNVSAEFVFDHIEESSVFKVLPKMGTIEPHCHLFIKIAFKPKACGSYSELLYCLVWGGNPIMIQLCGVCKTDCNDINISHFQSYPLPMKNIIGYTAYFLNCPNARICTPPVSMSRNYIDFGRALKSDNPESNFEFVTLKNNLENYILVKWPDDNTFRIVPNQLEILPSTKVSFKCTFHPDTNNRFYCKMLSAQINWIPRCVHGLILPITTTIKCQGHSFSENELWIPKVEVCPRIITLPSCVPEDPSYTTFKISVVGHLPVMYTLIPPKKTAFVIKPMVGIIDAFGIVVIQLHWQGTAISKVFKEVWQIQLNGRKEKLIPIYIRGEVSVPKIIIGEKNVVNFVTNQPGCQTITTVPLKNVSCYQIRFEFDNVGHDYLKVVPPSVILSPNDLIDVEFCYIGSLDHAKEIKLRCSLQRINKKVELVGTSYWHYFSIITNCLHQELCSTPTYHRFGEIQLNTPLETEFYLFNFGKFNVDFSLKIKYHSGNLDRIRVKPKFGHIKAREKVKIHVTGQAKTLGDRRIMITCSGDTVDKQSESSDEENNSIFEIQYVSVLPTIQVESIIEHNFGLLFSKQHLWDYLKIDEMNDYLRDMMSGESRSLSVYLPEVQVNKQTYFLTLEMENSTTYEMDVHLERKKLCECSLKEVAVNINTTRKQFDCVHRQMLEMQLSEPTFYAKTAQLLTITIRYLIPSETTMCYILHLPHNRSIEIWFTISPIPIDTFKLSCYNTEFCMNLKSISVRRRVPPIQICWFYNNTRQSVAYNVDIKNILYLCQKEGYEILKCINPVGTIDPFSSQPFMVKFQPIEIKEYVVDATVTFNGQVRNFYIKGSGQREFPLYISLKQMTNVNKIYYKFPAVLSPDFLPINSIPTWSTMERVIFVQNLSKDKVFQYIWEDVGIKDILQVSATNTLGVLQPQESQAVIIKIKTFNEACITTLQLACHFLDYAQLLMHQQSLGESVKRRLHNKEERNMSDDDKEDASVEHPEPFTKTVLLSLHIVHSSDRDNFFTLDQQFQSNPSDNIGINISNVLNSDKVPQPKNEEGGVVIKSQDKIKIQTVLERLIADFVFSNYLQEVLEYSKKLPSPVYNQFTLDERKIMEKKKAGVLSTNDLIKKFKLKQIKELFTKPKASLVSQVEKNLIINGIHETFKLGVFKSAQRDNEEETRSRLGSNSICCNCKKPK